MNDRLRLGVNIDHVATIRNARGGLHPDPARAAAMAAAAGADGITIHLREDRRHIRDEDLDAVAAASKLPINLEMAATSEMLDIALRAKPHAVCLVPEKRQERTTEGGLNIAGEHNIISPFVRQLSEAGIRVSLFIDAHPIQIAVAEALKAPVIELHCGAYADASDDTALKFQLEALQIGAANAAARGLEVHAGHGLTYDNVGAIAAIPELMELNIGHFLIGESIFIGLEQSIHRMRSIMDQARQPRTH
mgnify:CR=1 FL=1